MELNARQYKISIAEMRMPQQMSGNMIQDKIKNDIIENSRAAPIV